MLFKSDLLNICSPCNFIFMSVAIKLELCRRGFDQFFQKNLQHQVGKNENQSGNPSRRLLHTGLMGPAILSADVPRVSAEKQQRNSAQQMLENKGQRANRQRWDNAEHPPPPHPLPKSGGGFHFSKRSWCWKNEKQVASV